MVEDLGSHLDYRVFHKYRQGLPYLTTAMPIYHVWHVDTICININTMNNINKQYYIHNPSCRGHFLARTPLRINVLPTVRLACVGPPKK